jgi:peptide/nickel transport system permease protein
MTDIVATAAPPTPLAVAVKATLRAFNTNKASWIGLAIFLAVVLAAILAPLIAPYDPLEQDVLYRLKPPTAEHSAPIILGATRFRACSTGRASRW